MPPDEEDAAPTWEPPPRLRTMILTGDKFALVVDRIPEYWRKDNLERVREFAAEIGAAGVLVHFDEIQLPDDEDGI